jgi:hypothetical protein
MRVDLREIAYSRSGDKGDTSNVIVAAYDEGDYDWLRAHLDVEVVKRHFAPVVDGEIRRYEMPGTKMLNFVMERALQGGVSRSINLDMHGKSRASLILGIPLECDPDDPPPSGRGIPK